MSVANDLARALNPAVLAPAIGMKPDPWQADVLGSFHPRILLNCHRQSGKSTVASLLAIHTVLYEPKSTVLLVSPALRQSQELFKKCLETYRTMGRPVAADAENQLSLYLDNGSRIVSLPGKEATIRGYSAVRLIIIDEASMVTDGLVTALRPMLAVSGGRLIALSTPKGKRGWWWDSWENGGSVWKRVKVTADECPRITAEFLAEERRALGDRMFVQEYMGEFVETTDQAFGEDAIKKAFSKDLEPLSFEDLMAS